MISWCITADDDNGHQEVLNQASELGIGVTLSIRFRPSTWVENSLLLIELPWSLPKELEVQRDTNVARLQTTTIYNFFNKHLDRLRIKEYTSSSECIMWCFWISWDLQIKGFLFLQKTRTSSDLQISLPPLRPPESAVDGDLETYWATETGYPSAEFHLDLGSSQLVMVWESQVESDWWMKVVDITCLKWMETGWVEISWERLSIC